MEYKHFGHEHTLRLYKVEEGQQQCSCHGCQSPCNGSVYACWPCNFFLHEHCGNANRFVKHPSHPMHPLTLIPSPTYCSGSFLCNACGAPGNSFSYCCTMCEVDLHVNCAFLPRIVSHKSHQHELILDFRVTEGVSAGNCKICAKKLKPKNWSYTCAKPECDFCVHTFCATVEVKPGQYVDDSPDCVVSSATTDEPQLVLTPEALAEMMEVMAQVEMAQKIANLFASVQVDEK